MCVSRQYLIHEIIDRGRLAAALGKLLPSLSNIFGQPLSAFLRESVPDYDKEGFLFVRRQSAHLFQCFSEGCRIFHGSSPVEGLSQPSYLIGIGAALFYRDVADFLSADEFLQTKTLNHRFRRWPQTEESVQGAVSSADEMFQSSGTMLFQDFAVSIENLCYVVLRWAACVPDIFR